MQCLMALLHWLLQRYSKFFTCYFLSCYVFSLPPAVTMSSCSLQACDGIDDTAAAFAALCEPQHLRGQLALARRPVSAEATAACQSVSLQAAQQTFTAGLEAAAAFMAQAVQPATAAARERHAAEL